MGLNMPILIGKIDKLVYLSEDRSYGIYSLKHGRLRSTICVIGEQPKVLKTVDYKLTGQWNTQSRYGERFVVSQFSKAGNVPIYKPVRRHLI